MSVKKKVCVTLLILLILLTLAFIWGNSLLNAETSSKASEEVHGALSGVFDLIFGKDVVTTAVLRKLAHFGEFLLLGAEVCLLSVCIFGLKIKPLSCFLSVGLFVAIIDELLQFISARGPAVTDVLIDFSGFFTAYLFFALFYLINYLSKDDKKTE